MNFPETKIKPENSGGFGWEKVPINPFNVNLNRC